MATSVTVGDIYNTVCDVICEPWLHGTAPGLSLGVLTQAQFLTLFALVLEELVNKTSLIQTIFTQQIVFGTTQYESPTAMNEMNLCFVGGQFIDHSTLFMLDQWQYDWRTKLDTPEYWHEDGLPPKTLELAANPNYSGAGYAIPTGPTPEPPFGVNNLFNGATIGYFTGTCSVTSGTVTWSSGALFDAAWNNYYPPPNITLSGTAYPIQSVTSATVLVLAVTPADGTYAFIVSITNDGNLTMIGNTGISSITYALGDLVPVLPDSFCWGLTYGVLARVFSTDGEAKDMQRAAYCNARYQECANAGAAIAGMMAEIG